MVCLGQHSCLALHGFYLVYLLVLHIPYWIEMTLRTGRILGSKIRLPDIQSSYYLKLLDTAPEEIFKCLFLRSANYALVSE